VQSLSSPDRLKLFRPILAGANLRDRMLASLAAIFGIGMTGLVYVLAAPNAEQLVWLVPPMGASAVLLFAVPASPMAQPWAAIGGNTLSALVGVVIAHHMPISPLSAGLTVGLAIALMSITRCLHPPGGAAALVGLFAGASTSYAFPLLPVAANAVVLVGCAWVYHRFFSGHRFPHVALPPAPKAPDVPWTFSRSDLDAALEKTGETFDIDANDLERLLREIEQRAVQRSYLGLTCADIMTKRVISVSRDASMEEARQLLVLHDIRRLAVTDEAGRVVGVVGLRELAVDDGFLLEPRISVPSLASPETPAISLLDRFASGRVHAVFVTDEAQRPIGVITEADWLAVLTRGLA